MLCDTNIIGHKADGKHFSFLTLSNLDVYYWHWLLDHLMLVYIDIYFSFSFDILERRRSVIGSRVFPLKWNALFLVLLLFSQPLKETVMQKGTEKKPADSCCVLLWINKNSFRKGRMFKKNTISSTPTTQNPDLCLSLWQLWVVKVEKHEEGVRSVLISHSVKTRVKHVSTGFVVALLHKSYWHHVIAPAVFTRFVSKNVWYNFYTWLDTWRIEG